ncbi:MAG: hypothetical protein WA993_04360 [Candidatus Binatus sp.]|jgi:hypothetical protein
MSAKASRQGHSAAEWLTERPLRIFLLFAIEILAIDFLKLPDIMAWDHYAFCDAGANLTLQYVTSHGLRPTIDFGYNYGLLPILAGRIWFGIAGTTPASLQLLMTVCDLAIAWAIAKIVSRIRFGATGLALIAITLGFAVQASYPSLAQAVEAVLLVCALAYQARGSRASALAFACAAVFTKPSMGYIYSLVLLVAIVCQRRGAGCEDRPLDQGISACRRNRQRSHCGARNHLWPGGARANCNPDRRHVQLSGGEFRVFHRLRT